ncbi:hypothetical protein SDRG_05466 [Saprolegnia diclina VS20]|uniref:ENTH domain-containing protein n=1 Tax=Saprolegnia diclina (strain VS20) TaxID=1156394 RepID=T0QR65_SAPDV|nr:hypothetical protein SDRG_05466 [Saprolegnia diclina VS20]EQC37241.1 hypothetical protein SDRG_05466 [Saprolegnia diclina VS20]|eukprot:XP_008609403.1 hypothetical protein SDRG_05466 [Saprolegnia diclina VS20]
MDRVRAALDELVLQAKKSFRGLAQDDRSPVEKLLDTHLEDSALGPPTAALHDFAARTFNVVDCKRILQRLWLTIETAPDRPHVLRKVLVVLHHCVLHGADPFLNDVLVKKPLVRDLALHYNRDESQQYKYSKDLDAGAGVRKLAADLFDVLHSPSALYEARSAALQLQKKLSASGIGLLSPKASSSEAPRPSAYSDSPRPAPYTDDVSPSWELGGKGHIRHDDTADAH